MSFSLQFGLLKTENEHTCELPHTSIEYSRSHISKNRTGNNEYSSVPCSVLILTNRWLSHGLLLILQHIGNVIFSSLYILEHFADFVQSVFWHLQLTACDPVSFRYQLKQVKPESVKSFINYK